MSVSWDPPGVTHDLLEYLKAESIREESVWGGVRNRSEAQNGVSEPPTYLRMQCALGYLHSHLRVVFFDVLFLPLSETAFYTQPASF